jgi:hypothetical protein
MFWRTTENARFKFCLEAPDKCMRSPGGITSRNDGALFGVCLFYDEEKINYPPFKIPFS